MCLLFAEKQRRDRRRKEEFLSFCFYPPPQLRSLREGRQGINNFTSPFFTDAAYQIW